MWAGMEAAGRWLGAARRGDAGARLRCAVVCGAGVASLALFAVECGRAVRQGGAEARLVLSWDGRAERREAEHFRMPAVTLCPSRTGRVLENTTCSWVAHPPAPGAPGGPVVNGDPIADIEVEDVTVATAYGAPERYSCVTVNKKMELTAKNATSTIACTTGFNAAELDRSDELRVAIWWNPKEGKLEKEHAMQEPPKTIFGWRNIEQYTFQDFTIKAEEYAGIGRLPYRFSELRYGPHTEFPGKFQHEGADYSSGAVVAGFSVSNSPGITRLYRKEALYTRNQMFGVVGGLFFLICAATAASLAAVGHFFPAGTEDGLPVDPGLIFSGEATPSPPATAATPGSVSSFQRPRGGVRGASYGSLD